MGILDEQSPDAVERRRLERMWAQIEAGTYVPTAEDIEATKGVWVAGDPNAPQDSVMPMTVGGMPQQQPQQSPVMGPLADPAMSQQQGFQPSVGANELQQLYAIMAAGADDPLGPGMDYVKRMQHNDMLANQYRQSQNRLTDAQRPRPVGGGFLGATGSHVNPVWDPNANDGRGGFRYEQGPNRMPETVDVGGVKYVVNPNVQAGTPGWLIPAVGMDDATTNAAGLNQAQAAGTARGTDQAAAQILGGEMQVLDGRLRALMANPDFSGGVGLLDQFTGRVGAQFGSDEGLITKEANYISNSLTRSSVADWKGAISNAELNFFKDSVPQAGDGAAVWEHWYETYYKPTMAFVNARADGTLTQDNSSLSAYLNDIQQQAGGGDPTAGMTDAQRAAYEKYQ